MLIKESNNNQLCFPTKCTVCNTEARRLLHHVPHQGTFHRLCTNCVLRIHKHSFCRTCFHVSPFPTRICPVCANASNNAPVLQHKLLKEVDGFKFMDKESAKKLLAAAKIASQLMNEAAVKARAEAERKAKEAADARKKAKEALEDLANFVAKGKFEKKENGFVNGSKGYGMEGTTNWDVESNDEDLMELTAEIVELMMDVDDNDGMMDQVLM